MIENMKNTLCKCGHKLIKVCKDFRHLDESSIEGRHPSEICFVTSNKKCYKCECSNPEPSNNILFYNQLKMESSQSSSGKHYLIYR